MLDARTNLPIVKEERNHWRDLELSLRHKQWGFDCPAIDLDFILVEFDNYIPIALIEYKHNDCNNIIIRTNPGFQVLKNLANMAKLPLPAFFCKYKNDYSFSIMPLNITAIEILPKDKDGIWLSEKQYVDFLYSLRKKETPLGLFDLNGNLIMLL
jgi:hypothetical protein